MRMTSLHRWAVLCAAAAPPSFPSLTVLPLYRSSSPTCSLCTVSSAFRGPVGRRPPPPTRCEAEEGQRGEESRSRTSLTRGKNEAQPGHTTAARAKGGSTSACTLLRRQPPPTTHRQTSPQTGPRPACRPGRLRRCQHPPAGEEDTGREAACWVPRMQTMKGSQRTRWQTWARSK